jgi:DnaJ homolog subfamily C member 28
MSDIYDKFSDKDALERMRRQRREEDFRSAIDRIIDEAAAQGTFDDLPGKGKPLKLNKNPYAADQNLAFELLQNNDYTLPWIDKRNEIVEKVASLRAALAADWTRYQQRWQQADPLNQAERQAEWADRLRDYAAQVVDLNQEISRLNLTIPVAQLELLKLTVDGELKRAGASRVLGS